MADDESYRTMSIASVGASTIEKSPVKFCSSGKVTNLVSDIAGAQSYVKYGKDYKPGNRPVDTWKQQSDIPGTQSKQLHWKRGDHVADNQLRVDDIEGARARIRDRFHLTNRHVDALNPKYDLPSFTPAPPVVMKQHPEKDVVEGSSAKPAYVPKVIRDSLSTNDIVGASVGWRPRNE